MVLHLQLHSPKGDHKTVGYIEFDFLVAANCLARLATLPVLGTRSLLSLSVSVRPMSAAFVRMIAILLRTVSDDLLGRNRRVGVCEAL